MGFTLNAFVEVCVALQELFSRFEAAKQMLLKLENFVATYSPGFLLNFQENHSSLNVVYLGNSVMLYMRK